VRFCGPSPPGAANQDCESSLRIRPERQVSIAQLPVMAAHLRRRIHTAKNPTSFPPEILLGRPQCWGEVHGFSLRLTFETRTPAFSAGPRSVAKLTICETNSLISAHQQRSSNPYLA
jgi:hypothetical protein